MAALDLRENPMSTKPITHNGDLAQLPRRCCRSPADAVGGVAVGTAQDQERARKWTKPPRQARDPSRNAKSNDPDNLGVLRHAVNASPAGKADGIGYMLLGLRRRRHRSRPLRRQGQIDARSLGRTTTRRAQWRLPGDHRLGRRAAASSARSAGQRRTANSPSIARPAPASSSTATPPATSRSAVSKSEDHVSSFRRSTTFIDTSARAS